MLEGAFPSFLFPAKTSQLCCLCFILLLAVPCHVWDLVSQPGIELTPFAVEVQCLNLWISKGSPSLSLSLPKTPQTGLNMCVNDLKKLTFADHQNKVYVLLKM